jgi:excinuclease ABC subunit B
VEVHPAYLDKTAVRVEFFGDEIDRIATIDTLTGAVVERLDKYVFFPAKQFVTGAERLAKAMTTIREELEERVAWFEKHNKLVEAQRLRMRTEYDLEMMNEMGFCPGIENYSRHLTGRPPGARPYTLLDFFPKGFLTFIDESHVTIPQIGGMYEGDKSRKTVLVEHGFRLPSALDNRPLRFGEFMETTGQLLYVSATPGVYELVNSRPDNRRYIPVKPSQSAGGSAVSVDPAKLHVRPHPSTEPPETFDPAQPGTPLVVAQIIRPPGLLAPKITLRPLEHQIDETIELCRRRVEAGERVLVTTLTKKTAEDLAEYLQGVGLKVRYIHADIDAIERVEILRQLRAAAFDILVGINLLREGLDLPEVSLVCILDADKEGFLRNETSLIQTAGRAARHVRGECVLFCDRITDSIRRLVEVTEYRRARQREYNETRGITPQGVKRAVQESLHVYAGQREEAEHLAASLVAEDEAVYDKLRVISELEEEMRDAAAKLEFERAAHLRDQIKALKEES